MAIAFHMAGCLPYRPDAFAMVVYDKPILEKLGCENIKEAVARGLPGHRVCYFHPDESNRIEELQKVWDLERQRCEDEFAAEKVGKTLPPSPSIEISDVDMVRIVARTLFCRTQVTRHWQELPIFALVSHGAPEVHPSSGDSRGVAISHPGYVMVSIRAKRETMERLGLVETVGLDDEEGDDDED